MQERSSEEPFAINSRVEHTAWGTGTVLRYEGNTMTILFDTGGYKMLATEVVVEQGLVRSVTEDQFNTDFSASTLPWRSSSSRGAFPAGSPIWSGR